MFSFKKKQQEPIPAIPGKVALPSAVTLQFRRAQKVDESLAAAIRRVCRETPAIAACYLLDARKPETGEICLIIALTVDDEANQMDRVAQRFQEMLREFPGMADKTVIMPSATFLPACAKAEFHSRS